MTKAIIYARVSTAEQLQGYSIPAQLRALRQYAESHNFTLVKEFSPAESAKKEGRKQFGAMLEFLKQNADCRVIVCEKTDRLCRNLHDFVAVEDLVEQLGVEVHLVKEAQVIKKQAKSQDKLVQGIFALLARNYIENLQEEITKGQRIKAERGQYPGRAHYGYQHDTSTRTIKVDPNRAPIAKRCFELYASGSYSVLAVRLAIRQETGEKISKSQLHRMLSNRFYIGFFTWRGIEYKGAHETFIDHETFQRCQEVLGGRNGNKRRPHRPPFPFSGLLVCAKDDCRVVAEKHKQKFTYYHCSFGRGKHDFPYVREELLSEMLSSVMEGITIPEAVAQRIADSIAIDASSAEGKRRDQECRLRQRLTALEARLRKSLELKLDNGTIIDEKLWASSMNAWREEQRQLEAALERALEPAAQSNLLSAQRILELAQRAYSIYLTGNHAERGQLLKSVLLNCATDGVNLWPRYRKPFDLIFGRAKNEEWRR